MKRLGYGRYVAQGGDWGAFVVDWMARFMGSRPQTLDAIADSPVGLAAWLLDHGDGGGQAAAGLVSGLNRTVSDTGELTRDEILDNVTLYG
jgi:hypothetical protein